MKALDLITIVLLSSASSSAFQAGDPSGLSAKDDGLEDPVWENAFLRGGEKHSSSGIGFHSLTHLASAVSHFRSDSSLLILFPFVRINSAPEDECTFETEAENRLTSSSRRRYLPSCFPRRLLATVSEMQPSRSWPYKILTYCRKELRHNRKVSKVGNSRPIIGVLAQELTPTLESAFSSYSSYIGAADVKFIEAAGARVVPVLIGQDFEYYESIFRKTNGLLLPGGSVSITDSGKIAL